MFGHVVIFAQSSCEDQNSKCKENYYGHLLYVCGIDEILKGV